MIEIENLTVKFGGLVAVSDLSFAVGEGEVLTLMGPNGAGKTTAFNVIGGFVKATSGAIRVSGQPILGMSPEKISALGIRRTFQNNGILREMTVIENVLTGLNLNTPSTLIGSAIGWPSSSRAERKATQLSNEMLEEMGIASLKSHSAGSLSFGQQRLVEIARALVARPRLIMLDEPAVGLSLSERMNLVTVLRRLANSGISILLVEHVQDLVMAVSDQVLVLDYGKQIALCPPHEVGENTEILEAYLGHG